MAEQPAELNETETVEQPQSGTGDVADEKKDPPPRSGEGLIGLARLQKLKVKVQAVLGATPLSISELANLEKGDIIKLDTRIGDSISILANGEEIARAEIVVTQDEPPKFGLTLTEIIDTAITSSK